MERYIDKIHMTFCATRNSAQSLIHPLQTCSCPSLISQRGSRPCYIRISQRTNEKFQFPVATPVDSDSVDHRSYRAWEPP